MSPNEELARNLVEALNCQDWPAIASLVSSDFEWHTPKEGSVVGGQILRGVAGLQAFWEGDISDSWDLSQSRDEIEEAFDVGPDRLVARWRSYDVGRSSGVMVEHGGGVILDFRDHKIRRVRVYRSAEVALKQVGLLE